MKALLITDIQNDFLPGGALAVPAGDEVIGVINALQPHFDLVVATQDWHPANHGSFASAHEGKKPFETGTLGGLEQVLWPDHCVQGTSGAAFSESLSQHAIEAIFRKGMDPAIDSYSGFFDNRKLKDTGLGAYLKGRGVSQLFVSGLAGDFCVAYSLLDAIDLGLRTYLIEDATRPIDPAGFEKMKKAITEKGGKVIHSAAILQANQ
ncbi:MAG: bifunctional nicotinamidase/pyrazinamidase [Bacteroides sp.]|jgi:nicotinamidase/pyrazinamidase|nr:bifunctional nicotinamidase/pyrazinamidase [Bacteroides sp.]